MKRELGEREKSVGKEPDVILRIQGYGADGEGVAHLPNGMTCFVKNALKGELCKVHLEKVGRSCAWGKVKEILEASSERQESDCPWFGLCGGCALRHMSYTEELKFKRQKVQNTLLHVGGVSIFVPPVCGAGNILRYRNKAQFPVAPGPKIGLYQKKTHNVVDLEDCLLQSAATATIREAVKEWMERYRIPAYRSDTGHGLVRHLFIRTNDVGEILCCLIVNGVQVPHETELVEELRRANQAVVGIVLGINKGKNNVILGKSYRTLWGKDTLEEQLCGLTFHISVPSFFQVNRDQTEVLYAKLLELAGLTGRETVLDLYCGIGTISLVIAGQAGRVIGVEAVPSAIRDARINAEENNISNAEFLCADAGEIAGKMAADGLKPDLAIIDPPRKGASLETIEALAKMSPQNILYTSCYPATLARDLALFREKGYQPRSVSEVDMFPRTSHIETICSLYKQADTQ